MKLTMEEVVAFVHVLLHQQLVLMGIFATNDEVVLRRDEPEELLEPEHFPILVLVLHLIYLVLFQIT